MKVMVWCPVALLLLLWGAAACSIPADRAASYRALAQAASGVARELRSDKPNPTRLLAGIESFDQKVDEFNQLAVRRAVSGAEARISQAVGRIADQLSQVRQAVKDGNLSIAGSIAVALEREVTVIERELE